MLANYFARICAYYRHEHRYLIQFTPKVYLPWERHDNHLLLRIGRALLWPLTYYKQIDRINVLQLALNSQSRVILNSLTQTYPLL